MEKAFCILLILVALAACGTTPKELPRPTGPVTQWNPDKLPMVHDNDLRNGGPR